jgi:tRNA pseudouridine65 synthase
MHLTILYEDDDTLIVLKPSGLLVHRSESTSRDEPAVLQLLREQCGQRCFPLHRLDRATSGALVFAKSPQSARNLSLAWQSQACTKIYLAIVRGWPRESIEIHRALRDLDRPDHSLQDAHTSGRVLARIELDCAVETYPKTRYALLLLKAHTGRRHQLRRHLKQEHHPFIGDTVYGRGAHNRFFRERLDCQHLLLHHAYFAWPDGSNRQQSIEAPLVGAWPRVLAAYGWTKAYESAMKELGSL